MRLAEQGEVAQGDVEMDMSSCDGVDLDGMQIGEGAEGTCRGSEMTRSTSDEWFSMSRMGTRV